MSQVILIDWKKKSSCFLFVFHLRWTSCYCLVYYAKKKERHRKKSKKKRLKNRESVEYRLVVCAEISAGVLFSFLTATTRWLYWFSLIYINIGRWLNRRWLNCCHARLYFLCHSHKCLFDIRRIFRRGFQKWNF